MTELLTAARMRAIEEAAIGSGEVTGLDLMERAGRGVVGAIFEEWPELATAPHRAVVLCGPGNNGGDGFVVARLLKERGWEVEVFFHGDAGKLPPDARVACERWRETGDIAPFSEQGIAIPDGTDVVVDAIFGTGLGRPVADKALGRALRDVADCVDAGQGCADRVQAGFPLVVAVDMPSGLDADSGAIMGEAEDSHGGSRSFAARADLTVTFHDRKRGHLLGAGPGLCGKVVVADIGLGPWDGGRETP